MHATRAYRLQRAILASSSCASGNACDSPQRVVTPERITNWLSSIPTPRQPTPPPRQSVVTPVKPQSPRCNPEPVPEPRASPFHLRSKRLYFGQAPSPLSAKPRLSTPIQAKTPSVPTPAAQPAEEQDKPLPLWKKRILRLQQRHKHKRICPVEPTPEVWEEIRVADQQKRKREDLQRRERAEANLAQRHEPTQTSEPVKPSPSPEAAPDLAPDEVPEEPLPRRDSWELFYEPRIVELNAGQIPDLTTVPEQTEPSRSMATMSPATTETDNTGVPAPSPCQGFSVDSASFSQVSADSFTHGTFEHVAIEPAAADQTSSSVASESTDGTDPSLREARLAMRPVRVNAEGKYDATEVIREVLREEQARKAARSEARKIARRADRKAAREAPPVAPTADDESSSTTSSSDDVSAPSEVLEDLSSTPASPPQQASSESAQSDDSSASLDEPALPKVMLAAPPPPGDIFADVFDMDAPRVVTAPAAALTARPNLFDDLVLREEFYLPTPPPLQQQQQSTGVFGKIWTNAIAMAKASWTKVKSLVWR